MPHSGRTVKRHYSKAAKFKQLNNIYYEAGDPGSFGGVNALYKRAQELGIPVDRKFVTEYLSYQLPYSLHKPARLNFVRNHTYVGHIDQQWQADLADMQKLASDNDGYRYILTVIDVLSRYAWAVPVKSKSSKDMIIAFNKLARLARPRAPQKLQTDKGLEFFNREVSAWLRERDIMHFASNSDKKAAIVERFNRTLKHRLWRYFTAHDTTRYVNVLQDVVYAYNHSVHRTLKMRPADVTTEKDALRAWMNLYYPDANKSPVGAKHPTGQRVRIARWKGNFEKGYIPNWSREHFYVTKQVDHPQRVYKLEAKDREPIKGDFYVSEVQAIPRAVLQIERVIRRRRRGNRTEALVKFRGWDDKFNKWIPEAELPRLRLTPAERAKASAWLNEPTAQ